MAFNSITAFTGECNISQDKYSSTDYNAIILATEEKILRDLLGGDLYNKLIADLNGSYVPQTQKYIDLVNGKTYQVENGEGVTVNVDYKGIKPMLKYFCYSQLLKSQDQQNSMVGQVEPVQENSQRPAKNRLNILVENAYNKGVELYGIDIENYSYNDSFIRGKRYQQSIKKVTEFDYYVELVKSNCFNYLYYCSQNFATYYPTWMFTPKSISGFNGWL